MNYRAWQLNPANDAAADALRAAGFGGLLSRVLAARGIATPEAARHLLDESDALSDPFLLKDMDKAVERIRTAVEKGEPIVIFGDYDVDGVSATAILYECLSNMGAQVRILAPEAYARTGVELDAPRVNLAAMAQARFGWHAQTVSEAAHALEPGQFAANVLCLREARFSRWQLALLAQLSESGVPLVAVLLGGPYDAALVEKADAVIAAYEYTRLSAAAVLTAFETGRCDGLCPVRLQGV